MELDSSGMLPAGIHDPSMDEFYKVFIEAYPESQTRKRIFWNMLKCFDYINQRYAPDEVWLDGSFVTSKINPNDIDIIIFLRVDEFIKMSSVGDMNIRHVDVDSYYSLSVSQYNETHMNPADYNEYAVNKRNYWRGQYGFDRSDRPKGIVRFNWAKISEKLKGGIQGVNY